MTERKLATIEKIESLTPIEGADKIELAKVRGWNVVVQKGLYEEGDLAIYFEIDTMLPEDDERYASFMERGVRTDAEGRKGHVVKTIRLKGQYSQGLLMPASSFEDVLRYSSLTAAGWENETDTLGFDVTELVGVWKWEPPIPANLSGKVRGRLPGWVRKTDAERIQNFEDFLPLNPDEFYCTEKIDGSSASYSLMRNAPGDYDFHVCSRNLDLEETEGNTFWEIARKHHVERYLTKIMSIHQELDFLTIQGEVYGEGVNGNRLGLKGQHFAVFNVELPHASGIWDVLWDVEHHFPFVPKLDIPAPQSVSEALEAVDGMKSTLAKDRLAEGVVWRRKDGADIVPGIRSVKAISNKYLLKEKN